MVMGMNTGNEGLCYKGNHHSIETRRFREWVRRKERDGVVEYERRVETMINEV